MSKRTLAVVAALLFSLLVFNRALNAQQPLRSSGIKPAPANTAKTAKVLAAAGEILAEISQMRGLKILTPVKSGAKSRNEIEQEVIRNFEESFLPTEIDAVSKTMIAYGLVPQGFKYGEFMIKLMTEQVAGFYRPKSKELFIADWNELDQQKPVLAHELAHALQDQHFDLRRFEDWPRGDSDREAAIHALIEGDATGVMYNYQLKPMRTDITKLPSIANFADQSLAQAQRDGQRVFLEAPAAIRDSLIFPYVYGAGFVQELVRREGWPGVSRAFTNLPQSTEQILHFEKFLARETPVKVTLPDLSAALGAGWKRLDADVNGEFGYFLILKEFIDKKEARQAAAGWGGDQSTVYENAGRGGVLLAHRSVWDTTEDAAEFFLAYIKRTNKRYPGVVASRNQAANELVFQTPEGLTFIQRREKSVLAIEGLPAEEQEKLHGLAVSLNP